MWEFGRQRYYISLCVNSTLTTTITSYFLQGIANYRTTFPETFRIRCQKHYELWGFHCDADGKILLKAGTNFLKILEPPHNSRRHKGDTKQNPYWGPTNITSQLKNCSRTGDLTPGMCAPPSRPCREAYGYDSPFHIPKDMDYLGPADGVTPQR